MVGKEDNITKILYEKRKFENTIDFILEDKNINRYLCFLCKKIMIQPCQTKCGYRCCYICAKNYINNDVNLCPGCNEIIISIDDNLISDKAIEKEMNKLKLKCINAGCEEIIIFKDLKDHLQICKYRAEECEKCHELYLFGTKSQHLNDKCKNVLVSCKDCGEELLRKDMEMIHKNLNRNEFDGLCEKWSIVCPNNCQLNPVDNIKYHLDICPKQLIPCILSEFGCKSIVIRDNIENHIKDDLQSHLLLINKIKNKCLNKEHENVELKKENENLKNKINLLKNENKLINPKIENSNKQILSIENSKKRILSIENPIKIKENETFCWEISNIAEKIKSAKSGKDLVILSDEFYTAKPGYKMRLKAFPNGDGSGKYEYFSLYFVIMKGDYDDEICWPFKQIITFSLIVGNKSNQIMKTTLKPDNNNNCYGKPINKYNLGAGQPQFVKHEEIISMSKSFSGSLFIQMTLND